MVVISEQQLPFYLSAFGLEGSGGRVGWRLPNLRNPYLCNRLTDFLHSKFCEIWPIWPKTCQICHKLGPDFAECILLLSLKLLDGFTPFKVLLTCLDLCTVIVICPFAPYGLAHWPKTCQIRQHLGQTLWNPYLLNHWMIYTIWSSMELSRPVVVQHHGHLTLTLDFQGQIVKMLYLRNGRADWHGTKRIWVDRMLHPLCDFQLWLQPWPWPWIFNVKFSSYLGNGMADWHGIKGMGVDRMLDPCCDFQLAPHSWPWPWIFKVKFWKSLILWMG